MTGYQETIYVGLQRAPHVSKPADQESCYRVVKGEDFILEVFLTLTMPQQHIKSIFSHGKHWYGSRVRKN